MSVLAAVGVTEFIVGFVLVMAGVSSTIFDVHMRWDYVSDVVVKVGLALMLGAILVGLVALVGLVWSEVAW